MEIPAGWQPTESRYLLIARRIDGIQLTVDPFREGDLTWLATFPRGEALAIPCRRESMNGESPLIKRSIRSLGSAMEDTDLRLPVPAWSQSIASRWICPPTPDFFALERLDGIRLGLAAREKGEPGSEDHESAGLRWKVWSPIFGLNESYVDLAELETDGGLPAAVAETERRLPRPAWMTRV